MIRQAAVMGQFYPGSESGVLEMFGRFNGILEQALEEKTLLSKAPRAVIVPHAGYAYSGFTANVAYRLLSNTKPRRVIVVGPSHRIYFEGISGSFFDSVMTPFGPHPVDQAYLESLKDPFSLMFQKEAHAEHSTETQFPFIRHYLGDVPLIELVYGKINPASLVPLFEHLLDDSENVLVISTDLSHFYTLEEANKIDNVCISAIAESSPRYLENGCEACGGIGVEAMILSGISRKLNVKVLDYRTSADASGDNQRVVGYVSAAYFE